MTWYLHCSHCNEKAFQTETDPKPKHGDALIAQDWKYMDGSQVGVGDPFFCKYCECDFQPMVEGVSKGEYDKSTGDCTQRTMQKVL